MTLQLTKNILLSGMLIMIVACGGGGGGETADTGVTYTGTTSPATLTDSNAGHLAGSALDNGEDGGALVLSATVTNSSNGSNTSHSLTMVKTIKDLVAHIEANPETISTVHSLALTTQTDSISGDCGGEATFTFTGGTNGSFSGSMSFSSFCNGGERLDGTVTISGEADGRGQIETLKMTFNLLTFTNGTESFAAFGSVTVSTATGTVNVEMKMRNRSTNRTCWVNNYTITLVDRGNYEEISISSGRFYDSVHGYVEVVTTSPLLKYYTDEYPFAGSLKITGQNGTAILTALSAIHYQLEIDNDGIIGVDITQTGLWADL